MTGSGRKHFLPAGVLPTERIEPPEDSGSHVRRRAPPPALQTRTAPNVQWETPAEHARALVDHLRTLGAAQVGPIVRRLVPLGNFALEEIVKSFPEPLWHAPPTTACPLPRPEEISATAAALTAFGDEAVPYLARLMQSPRADVRYHAALVCAAHSHAGLIEPLARVALDEDLGCRRIARHLLNGYRHEPAYQTALGKLRRRASDASQPSSLRRRAISTLTQLRDDASTALFVDLLTDSDRGIATAARVGLRVLTAHELGSSKEPWLRWLSERRDQERTEWLIEGLGDGRASIRLLASRELWALTRFLEPLSETDERATFVTAQQRYRRWWTEQRRA